MLLAIRLINSRTALVAIWQLSLDHRRVLSWLFVIHGWIQGRVK